MMLKKEIIKIYNNNENTNIEKENTFIIDNDQLSVDMVKLKSVFSQAKKLILEIMSSDETEKFITIEINPLGYVNSKRIKKDGITYFGYDTGEGQYQVDFILKSNDNYYYDDAFNGRHFMIKFNPNDLNYYLKDLGRGFGTFIKIQEWTELVNNLLLNIGENYIVFSFGDEDDEEEEEDEKNNNISNNKDDNSLNIKIFSLNAKQKIYKLLPSDCPITIGRSSENNIYIDDDMLSRIHCTIDFSNDKWYIQDGLAKNGIQDDEIKKSTNGSWIYAYDEIPIVNKMIFKANHNLFICNLV
jgi:pSer/pThr/pTyr-binding forkhead associated (FHA) protein